MPSSATAMVMACLDEDGALALVEGRLPIDEAGRARDHVKDCAACRRLVATVAQVVIDDEASEHSGWGGEDVAVPPGTTLSSYTVIEQLGRGGMGVVYLAHDARLDRKVALKVIRPAAYGDAAVRRLRREAKLMAALNHPNIVAVHDVGVSEYGPFLVMELVDGVDLKRWLSERDPTASQILSVFRRAGRGLVAAHAAGIVHRDFKPHNVLIGQDGRVRVADFGVASARPQATATPAMTDSTTATTQSASGMMVGTPAYVAPEQLRGRAVDARADQFSFCVALWEALHGQRPFTRNTAGEIQSVLDEGTLPRRAPVPRRLDRALVRGLHPAPSGRHPSMSVLLAALRPHRRRWWVGLAAVAMVVLAGLGLTRPEETRRCQPPMVSTPSALDPAARSRIDGYVARWQAAYREACEAGGPKLDLVMVCLREHRQRFETLSAVVGGRVELTPVEECFDAARRPPGAEQMQRELNALRVRAMSQWEQDRREERSEILTALAQLRERAKSQGVPAVEAEAGRMSAVLVGKSGDLDGAVRRFEEAYFVAELGDEPRLAFTTALDLVTTLASVRDDAAGGQVWVERASAVLPQMRATAAEQARLSAARAAVAVRRGEAAAAMALYDRALAELPDDAAGHIRADMLCSRGDIHSQNENLRLAMADYSAALDVVVAHDGPSHPDVIRPLNGRAIANMQLGELGAAARDLEQALAVQERLEDEMQLGFVLGNLGQLYSSLGEHERSIIAFVRTAQLLDRSLGPADPNAAKSHLNLAWAYGRVGRWRESRDAAAEAARWLGEHDLQRSAMIWVAECEIHLANPSAALEAAAAVLKLPRLQAKRRAITRGIQGRALLHLGRPTEALAVLADVVPDPDFFRYTDPIELADALLAHATALAATGKQAEAARQATLAAMVVAPVPGVRADRLRTASHALQ